MSTEGATWGTAIGSTGEGAAMGTEAEGTGALLMVGATCGGSTGTGSGGTG